jgi:hypothetical protein
VSKVSVVPRKTLTHAIAPAFTQGKYGLYGYHTFQFEPLDQWINEYRETVHANFKAMKSHGTVSWIRFLHQRMLLMNRTIETLCLEKQENVRSDNPIP